MMVIENKFNIGDTVYLITDDEQKPRIIVSFVVYRNGDLLYKVCFGIINSEHYDFELSSEKNLINV